VLKDDKRAIFTAASHAQRAADFLHGLQPGLDPEACPQIEVTHTPAEPQAREFERLDY
jgi:antirestriction protein ArdC